MESYGRGPLIEHSYKRRNFYHGRDFHNTLDYISINSRNGTSIPQVNISAYRPTSLIINYILCAFDYYNNSS